MFLLLLAQALDRNMNPSFWDASSLNGGSSNSKGSSGSSSNGGGGGATLGGSAAPQGASERRAAAAAAAEARQQDWRQGGSKDAAKGAAVAQRRQKVLHAHCLATNLYESWLECQELLSLRRSHLCLFSLCTLSLPRSSQYLS